MGIKYCVRFLVRSMKSAAMNPRFWTKVIALMVNTVIIILWRVEEENRSGLGKNEHEETLFAHTVPGYEIVLSGVVLIYLLGEEPGKVFHRLFFISGIILFVATGSLGIYNTVNEPNIETIPLVIGILCIVVAIIFVVDEVLNEVLSLLKTGGSSKKSSGGSDGKSHES